MKKLAIFLLVVVHLGLLAIFLSNQFGVGPAWAEVQEKEEATKAEKKKTKTGKIIKSTDTKKDAKQPLKRPKGISDLEWEKLKAKKVLPYDKGPSTVDVSKYPKEMQEIYKKVFTKKCSKCHTIARAINAPYALPEEWKKYIKKMMKKPGSGINPKAAKKIYKFLVYDSSIRKQDVIKKKLKEKEESEKIKPKTSKRKDKKK